MRDPPQMCPPLRREICQGQAWGAALSPFIMRIPAGRDPHPRVKVSLPWLYLYILYILNGIVAILTCCAGIRYTEQKNKNCYQIPHFGKRFKNKGNTPSSDFYRRISFASVLTLCHFFCAEKPSQKIMVDAVLQLNKQLSFTVCYPASLVKVSTQAGYIFVVPYS